MANQNSTTKQPKLTKAQLWLLINLNAGFTIYRHAVMGLYIRLEHFESHPVRRKTLDKLVDLGYVEGYTITEAGRAALNGTVRE